MSRVWSSLNMSFVWIMIMMWEYSAYFDLYTGWLSTFTTCPKLKMDWKCQKALKSFLKWSNLLTLYIIQYIQNGNNQEKTSNCENNVLCMRKKKVEKDIIYNRFPESKYRICDWCFEQQRALLWHAILPPLLPHTHTHTHTLTHSVFSSHTQLTQPLSQLLHFRLAASFAVLAYMNAWT